MAIQTALCLFFCVHCCLGCVPLTSKVATGNIPRQTAWIPLDYIPRKQPFLTHIESEGTRLWRKLDAVDGISLVKGETYKKQLIHLKTHLIFTILLHWNENTTMPLGHFLIFHCGPNYITGVSCVLLHLAAQTRGRASKTTRPVLLILAPSLLLPSCFSHLLPHGSPWGSVFRSTLSSGVSLLRSHYHTLVCVACGTLLLCHTSGWMLGG